MVREFGIEIGAAFGQLQGKIWRIGTMGYSARRQNILLGLAALEASLSAEGFSLPMGAGVAAAAAHYQKSGAGHDDAGDSLGASGTGQY
jgi:(S)-ureidoglycine-glyoxylate aminotransferase